MTIVMPDTGKLLVACPCGWDANGTLELVDRWITDYPPIPRCEIFELYTGGCGDPDDRVSECPECGEWLDETTVIPC